MRRQVNMLITVLYCWLLYILSHDALNCQQQRKQDKKKTNNIIIIIICLHCTHKQSHRSCCFVCFHLFLSSFSSFDTLWDLNNGVGVYLPLDCHFSVPVHLVHDTLRELLSTCFTPFKRITRNNVATRDCQTALQHCGRGR